jgi:hypothetical protein
MYAWKISFITIIILYQTDFSILFLYCVYTPLLKVPLNALSELDPDIL